MKRKPCLYADQGCRQFAWSKGRCYGHLRIDFPPEPRQEAPKRAGLARRAALPRKPKPRAQRRAQPAEGIPAESRVVVLGRCGGRCEACGHPLLGLVHLHHRQRRREGNHSPANLVALHPDCHVVAPQAVHQRPTWARQRGLIVPSWETPGDAPLILADGRSVLLGDEACYLPTAA